MDTQTAAPGLAAAADPAGVVSLGLGERRVAVGAARSALAGLEGVLPGESGAGLGELLALVDEVAALAGSARAVICAEAIRRGQPAQESLDAHGWLVAHAPSLRQGGSRQVAQLAAKAAAAARGTGLGVATGASSDDDGGADTVGSRLDPGSPLGMVWARLAAGEVGVPVAAGALREVDRIGRQLRPEGLPWACGALLDFGVQWGPSMMSRLRQRLLAEFGHDGDADKREERLAPAAFLSRPSVREGDLTEYRMALTPEQAAILEAAIDKLSAPRPNGETGEPDARPAGQRRVEALVEIVSRAVRADVDRTDPHTTDGPAGSSMALHVCIQLGDLLDLLRRPGTDDHCGSGTRAGSLWARPDDSASGSHGSDDSGRAARAGGRGWPLGRVHGCGEVIGTTADGTILSPGTIRRMCCDGGIIPTVLGSDSEILDLGRVERLYSRAQRRLMALRDRHCTYPGCDAPTTWARAHHVHHWWDGGPTDIHNGALLCERHHTIVHNRRLWAEVRDTPDESGRHVIWDLTPGSYDRHIRPLAATA